MPAVPARAAAALVLLVILAACGAAGGNNPASKSRPAAPSGASPAGASEPAAARGVEFDALRWQLLGVPASDTNLCVATRASGLHSIAEVMNPGGKAFVIGGAAPGSAIWDVPMRLKSALDLNLRVVEGYDGTAKVRLAMDQNE